MTPSTTPFEFLWVLTEGASVPAFTIAVGFAVYNRWAVYRLERRTGTKMPNRRRVANERLWLLGPFLLQKVALFVFAWIAATLPANSAAPAWYTGLIGGTILVMTTAEVGATIGAWIVVRNDVVLWRRRKELADATQGQASASADVPRAPFPGEPTPRWPPPPQEPT